MDQRRSQKPRVFGESIPAYGESGKENAPTGVDPYEVDEVDVKAALLLGFSKEAATEHGRKEAVSRILKYTGDGIRKMEAKQE